MVAFIDHREDGGLTQSIVGMKFSRTGLTLDLEPGTPVTNLFVPTSIDASTMMLDDGWDLTAA